MIILQYTVKFQYKSADFRKQINPEINWQMNMLLSYFEYQLELHKLLAEL